MLLKLGCDVITKKGTRLLELKRDYCVLDIETTGFNPGWDEIIEICAIKVRNNQIIDKFISLIKPENEIPSFISNLTGITNDLVKNAPSLDVILPLFIKFVQEDIILGHNVSFDLNFISEETTNRLNQPFLNNYIDTLPLSRRTFSDIKHHSLIALATYLPISKPTHRAESDCIATKDLYDLILKTAEEKNIDLFGRKKSKGLKAKEIAATVDSFDEDHPFFQKVCIFTGTLSIPRRKAMQMIANVGGINGDNVTKETNFLIVGSTDYIASLKGNKSSKLKKAEKLIQDNQDIKILTEKTFLDLLNN